MAGPVVSLILSKSITEEQKLFIRNEIKDISDNIEGDDFWVQERPFIVIIGPEYEEEIDEYIDNGLNNLYEEEIDEYIDNGLNNLRLDTKGYIRVLCYVQSAERPSSIS